MIDKRMTRAGEARYEVRLRGTDGKERSRTFRTKKEAERYERAHHAAIDSGVWIDPRAGRVTLTSWAAEWQRSEEHTSELQSLMRISYAVFCLKTKTQLQNSPTTQTSTIHNDT